MQEQMDRIEKKLDKALESIAVNKTDITWLKRIVIGGAALFATTAVGVAVKLLGG